MTFPNVRRNVAKCDQCRVVKEVFEADLIRERKKKGEEASRHRLLCLDCYRKHLGFSSEE